MKETNGITITLTCACGEPLAFTAFIETCPTNFNVVVDPCDKCAQREKVWLFDELLEIHKRNTGFSYETDLMLENWLARAAKATKGKLDVKEH